MASTHRIQSVNFLRNLNKAAFGFCVISVSCRSAGFSGNVLLSPNNTTRPQILGGVQANVKSVASYNAQANTTSKSDESYIIRIKT